MHVNFHDLQLEFALSAYTLLNNYNEAVSSVAISTTEPFSSMEPKLLRLFEDYKTVDTRGLVYRDVLYRFFAVNSPLEGEKGLLSRVKAEDASLLDTYHDRLYREAKEALEFHRDRSLWTLESVKFDHENRQEAGFFKR